MSGGVVIPMEIRKSLRLRSEQRFVVEARGEVIVLRPRVDVDEFIAQFKGCISGSKVKASELKEIGELITLTVDAWLFVDFVLFGKGVGSQNMWTCHGSDGLLQKR